MSIRKMFFIALLSVSSACSSDLFLDSNGNMPDKSKIEQIHLGQSKDTVYSILGAPSSISGLSDDHWIYMSSGVKKVAFMRPQEVERQVLAITFDNDQVSKIDKKTLADGNDIKIDEEETQSTEREQGFFKKYFGGVGTYMPFGGDKNSKGL
ncbi:MAG: outer membrane protein assembly factor BamE [Alphaproteobacteria bacterium]|nr:outer membrane protein assembly factor BamE [Alphaproteobacteria bacterium]